MSTIFICKNNKKMEIRELKPSDAKLVLDYLCLVGGETNYLLMDSQGLGIEIEEEERILERFYNNPNILLLGCFDGDELVAVSNLSTKEREKIKHISTLGVSVKKQYWSLGIGRNLMNFMIDFAKKNEQIEILQLEVRSDNLSAINLYKSLGFYSVGLVPKAMKIDHIYYENLIMVLEVK